DYVPFLTWIMQNHTLVGFNSNNYDIPILQAVINGYDTTVLKEMSDAIIKRDEKPYDLLKGLRVIPIACDTFDLMEVAPLRGSLKLYAGRQHARRMQDLPFHPDTELNEDQKLIVRWYCVNDTRNTDQLLKTLA